jgi:hypothetical protein
VGEAVAEHSDEADPAGGQAIGAAGMFHKQPAERFGEMLEINLHGSVRCGLNGEYLVTGGGRPRRASVVE